VKAKRRRKDDEACVKSEVKITFSPLPVSEVDLSTTPEGEDWSKFAGKDGTPYDPMSDVECEILKCFLDHGLPEGALEQALPPAKTTKKRKATEAKETSESSSGHKRRKLLNDEPKDGLQQKARATKARTKSKAAACSAQAENDSNVKNTTDKEITAPAQLHPPSFKPPRAIPLFKLNVIDLCDSKSDSESEGIHATGPANSTATARAMPVASTSEDQASVLLPGEVIAPATLRQLRAASSLLHQIKDTTMGPPIGKPAAGQYEVIDLT
jgi:Holliday junction resolvase YEN1